jgi:DNA-binding MarR family transcriptional regulator
MSEAGRHIDAATESGELRGTGAHLDTDELFAWTRFLDAGRLVEEMLSRHLATEHEMTHSDYEVLVRLDGAGNSMRLSTLAEQCVSSKSKLTHTLDRLEVRGWIERHPSADDRRGIVALLTPTGSDVLAAAAVGHAALIKEHLLDVWHPAELPVIAGAMERVALGLRARRPTAPARP